jgi:hypothetical protein
MHLLFFLPVRRQASMMCFRPCCTTRFAVGAIIFGLEAKLFCRWWCAETYRYLLPGQAISRLFTRTRYNFLQPRITSEVMAASPQIEHLLAALRERQIPLGRDDVQWAFTSPQTKVEVSNWVQDFLGDENLLSKEELEL